MIVISGGTGLVGSAVVRELTRRGNKVAVLGRSEERIRKEFPDERVEPRPGDVTEVESLRRAFAGVDTVVNAVQFPNSPIENPAKGWTFERIDYRGTLNQVEAAKSAGVKRFIYVSGVGASPNADKHWFRFKWQAEEAVRSSGIPYAIIRPTWVYGPNDVALNRFIGFARTLQFVPLFGDGKQLMQPIFIDDLAWLIAEAATRPEPPNDTLEAGGPDILSMDTVIKTALDVAGVQRPILHQPVWVGKMMATLLRFMPGRPLTPDAIDFITHEATADNSALERVFEPHLTSLRTGLTSYLGQQEIVGAQV